MARHRPFRCRVEHGLFRRISRYTSTSRQQEGNGICITRRRMSTFLEATDMYITVLGPTQSTASGIPSIGICRSIYRKRNPVLSILEVNGFYIRGSGRVDDIRLLSAIPSSWNYEDAEDGSTDGWVVYDNDPAGGEILNVYDGECRSRVIELSGSGTANGYRLRNDNGTKWHNTFHFVIEWSMAYSERFHGIHRRRDNGGQTVSVLHAGEFRSSRQQQKCPSRSWVHRNERSVAHVLQESASRFGGGPVRS